LARFQLLIIGKTLMSPNGGALFFRSAFSFRHMGFLTAFTVVAVVGAFVLPKVFLGQVQVFPLRSDGNPLLMPLQPSSANLTQSAYLVISYLTAVVFALMVKSRSFIQNLRTAIIGLACMVIVTGVVEYGLGVVGAGSVLDMFRTASYTFMLDNEVQGMRRIIGLMTEASAYGFISTTALAMLIFYRNLFDTKQQQQIIYPLAAMCGILAILCTSSAAYVSVAVIVVVYFWDVVARLGMGQKEEKLQVSRELVGIFAFSLIGLIAIFVFQETRDIAFNLLDEMVFKKGQSSSFAERSSWNEAGISSFLQSMGAGVGVGSIRTSNFFVNIIGATGIVGSFFFFSFLLKVFMSKCQSQDVKMIEAVRGAKLILVPILVNMALAGTTPDYGVVVAVLFGIVIGGASAVRKPSSAVKTDAPLLPA
jgi:hypothetical protein